MKKNVRKETRKGDKLSATWARGYEVVSVSSHTAVIKNRDTDKELRTISLAHLKPYRERSDTTATSSDDDLPCDTSSHLDVLQLDSGSGRPTHTDTNTSTQATTPSQTDTPPKDTTTPSDIPTIVPCSDDTPPVKPPTDTTTPEDTSDDVIILQPSEVRVASKRKNSDPTNPEPAKRLCRPVHLSERDQRIMLDNKAYLTDTIIDKAQAMLARQHSNIDSLQSVCLLEATTTQSHLGTATGDWVQIFNVNGNHWITATNIRSPPDTVSIYDSLWSKKPSDSLIEQISILTFSTNNTKINIDFKDMQRQSGGIDCGLFAIASAACLCEGTDPSVHAWNQNEMRKHLNDCFETGTIQLFKSAKRRNRKSKAVQTVLLHCLCRTGRISKKDMVLCKQCHLYHHYTCVNLSAPPTEPYTCQNCNV